MGAGASAPSSCGTGTTSLQSGFPRYVGLGASSSACTHAHRQVMTLFLPYHHFAQLNCRLALNNAALFPQWISSLFSAFGKQAVFLAPGKIAATLPGTLPGMLERYADASLPDSAHRNRRQPRPTLPSRARLSPPARLFAKFLNL